MKCYYEILEITRDADDGEIKTAYRKLALRWHPDKNMDNTEAAKDQFQLVQQAYEVLSDKHERAWYDNHREQILRGSDSNFQDDSLDVFPYFTTQCFRGYGDDEKGFYTVYRNVFDKITKEDIEYMDSKSDYDEIPAFGNSNSDYDEIVAPFYAYWMSYNTKKSYVWLDPYNINETRERRVLKLIEKENKKVRQKAKKERNEEIRNLVAFVRKRDKRVQAYAKLLEAKNAENRQKQEELRKQKLIERNKEMNTKMQAEWSKFDNVQHQLEEIEKKLAEQFGEELTDSNSESAEEDCTDLYCVACNKVFKNPKAFANHESSKKHKENIKKLKLIMYEEESLADEENEEKNKVIDDKEVGESINDKEIEDENIEDIIDSEISLPSDIEDISQSSKKKNKKNKKVIRNQHNYESDNYDSEKESEVLNFTPEKNTDDYYDFDSSKKQKKKTSKNKTTQGKTQSTKNTNNETTESEEKLNDETKSDTPKAANNEKFTKTNMNKMKNKKNIVPVDISEIDVSHCCVTCKSNFNSKNKLFEHLKKTGHSVLISHPTQKISKSKKKQIQIPLRAISQGILRMRPQKLVNSSAERNKAPILEILKQYLKPDTPGNVLEISSGTGQHVAFIAEHFPNLTFQPSEYDQTMLKYIKLYSDDCKTHNIKNPLHIDVCTPNESWGLHTREFDYMLNINMIHITPYTCVEHLFKNAGILLKSTGLLITYGPYANNGILEPESNVRFNKMLQMQNPEWGVRDIVMLEELAQRNGIELINIHDMPSNNKCLIWKKM